MAMVVAVFCVWAALHVGSDAKRMKVNRQSASGGVEEVLGCNDFDEEVGCRGLDWCYWDGVAETCKALIKFRNAGGELIFAEIVGGHTNTQDTSDGRRLHQLRYVAGPDTNQEQWVELYDKFVNGGTGTEFLRIDTYEAPYQKAGDECASPHDQFRGDSSLKIHGCGPDSSPGPIDDVGKCMIECAAGYEFTGREDVQAGRATCTDGEFQRPECTEDPCKDVNFCGEHGSNCKDGKCKCKDDYTGDKCDTAPVTTDAKTTIATDTKTNTATVTKITTITDATTTQKSAASGLLVPLGLSVVIIASFLA